MAVADYVTCGAEIVGRESRVAVLSPGSIGNGIYARTERGPLTVPCAPTDAESTFGNEDEIIVI